MLVLVGAVVLVWRGRDASRAADGVRRQTRSVAANADAFGAQVRALRDRIGELERRAAGLGDQTKPLVAARRAVSDEFRAFIREAVATTNAQTLRIAALNRAVDAANAGDRAGKARILADEVAPAEAQAEAALVREQRARARLEAALAQLGKLTT